MGTETETNELRKKTVALATRLTGYLGQQPEDPATQAAALMVATQALFTVLGVEGLNVKELINNELQRRKKKDKSLNVKIGEEGILSETYILPERAKPAPWMPSRENLTNLTLRGVNHLTVDHATHTVIAGGLPGTFDVHDGYHTLSELYEHRHALFYALCSYVYIHKAAEKPWMARTYSDGTSCEGYFIAGYLTPYTREAISYHIPMKHWDMFAKTCNVLDEAPKWDGHTSQNVLERLWGE